MADLERGLDSLGSARALQAWAIWSRWEDWTRGLSLTLLGIVMLVISRVPFLWVGRLFALAGLLLVLRGLIGSILVLRPR